MRPGQTPAPRCSELGLPHRVCCHTAYKIHLFLQVERFATRAEITSSGFVDRVRRRVGGGGSGFSGHHGEAGSRCLAGTSSRRAGASQPQAPPVTAPEAAPETPRNTKEPAPQGRDIPSKVDVLTQAMVSVDGCRTGGAYGLGCHSRQWEPRFATFAHIGSIGFACSTVKSGSPQSHFAEARGRCRWRRRGRASMSDTISAWRSRPFRVDAVILAGRRQS